MKTNQLERLPSARGPKVIPFDRAQVIPGFITGTYFLVVEGNAPCANMDVELVPLIYVSCPDYWEIEITGTLRGCVCLDTITPYARAILLTGITGSKGIEVVGANRRERFDVKGGCTP